MTQTNKLRPALLLIGFFIFTNIAIGQSMLEIAQNYIQNNKDNFHLEDQDLQDLILTDQYQSKKSGIHHLYFQQTLNGIPIRNAHININISREGNVINMGNSFVPKITEKAAGQPTLSASEALQLSIQHLKLNFETPKIITQETKATQLTVFAHKDIALQPIKTQLKYVQKGKKEIRIAWEVSIYLLNGQHWWNVTIDAADGTVLSSEDKVIHCQFDDHANCTNDGHSHIPTSTIERKDNQLNHKLKFDQLSTNPDSYLVYPLGVESPNHGSQSTVINPADPIASPFGWHDNDGNIGAEFTITRGNNVLAQEDINGNNGNGFSPDAGQSLDFAYNLDLTQSPNTENATVQNQSAAITNLFYWNNIMHDVWYQYGFDEAAGNFQDNNYGNGGAGGDYILADAQDGSGTNNANFSTPADGENGRMQMFLWNGGGATVTFDVNIPSNIAQSYSAAPALFGPNNYNVTGNLIIVNASSGTPSEGCDFPNNAATVNGNIALIDRGNCDFSLKVLEAQNAGAIAVIICNNVSPGTIQMGPGGSGDLVTIPSIMISQDDCANIRVEIPTVNVTLSAISTASELDGDFDNGIIAHEYGHGISIRLTGGPSNSGCLNNDEQQGEGWSDWFGLVLTQKPEDDRNTPRGIGTYASGQSIDGNGIRTYPYTTDMNVNPHTYSSISNEFIPHGVGSVWGAMIWDMYWDLIDEYGYDPDVYSGSGGNNIAMQLVIEGLKLQPCNAGFVESRDAILLADNALYNGANYCLIWSAFARRGLGFSASQGNADDVDDGTEAFDTPPDVGGLEISKTSNITEATPGEKILFTLEINNLCVDATNVSITDNLPIGLTYVDGSASSGGSHVDGILSWPNIPFVPKGEQIIYTYEAELASGTYSPPSTIIADDMENGNTNWTTANSNNLSNWTLANSSACGSTAWFAEEGEGDPNIEHQYLTLDPITIQASTLLRFSHAYDTEVNWDGGKVQLSLDGGSKWSDLGGFMTQNGYNDFIQNNTANAAFSGLSGTSGECIETIIDLGSFCGAIDALIRFDFYYDQLVAGNGWYIDEINITTETAVINTATVTTNAIESNAFTCVKVLEPLLPIELLNFDALAQKESILLNWTTEMEINNAGFSLMRRSEKEELFKSIAWIASQTTSTEQNQYAFEDNDVQANTKYYYQLIQMDNDEKSTASNIVSAEIKTSTLSIEVYPNPTKNKRFDILLQGEIQGDIQIEIINTQDQLLMRKVLESSNNSNHIHMEVDHFPSGIYFVNIKTNEKQFVKKIIVD